MGFQTDVNTYTHAKLFLDYQMKKHTALKVGGRAKYYVEADSLYTLNRLVQIAKHTKTPYKILGNGSNVLISDKGYNGVIISVKKLNDVFFKREKVRAMAGASLEKLLKFTLDHKLTGVEWATGIPATIGGAVVMNAGAFGHTLSESIETVETLDKGRVKIYDKADCKFGYRKSRFLGKKEIIISATFNFKEWERDSIILAVKSYSEIRKSLQPNGRSCGSVFKNPKPYSAGILIDKAGLKGYKIGGAKVSEKHGNFIITENECTATDVYNLINFVKEKIKYDFDVELKEEVQYIGEF